MTSQQISSTIIGILGLGLLIISAWLSIKNKDFDELAFVGIILIMVSCSRID